MTKVETIICEYGDCSACIHCDSTWISHKSPIYCTKVTPEKRLNRKTLYTTIPDWCPLPGKEVV